jgi:ssDNA-binding Zn-finger/Zn-ribbon topoisomerase 1
MNITAQSSNGYIKFDSDTGKIVECFEYPDCQGTLCNIKLINVRALRAVYPSGLPADVDILECGYWDIGGKYEPPLSWDAEGWCFVEREESHV